MNMQPGVAKDNVRRIGRDEGTIVDVLGIYCEWKITEAESGGHYCMFEMQVQPGAMVPPHQHVMPETFYVTAGEAEFFRIGSHGPEWIPARPGEAVHIPSWAMHGFRNSGRSTARILLICSHGFEALFREMGVPVAPGAPLPSTPPSQAAIDRVLAISAKHGVKFAPPPPA